ncbi:cytochrome c3 family protein [Geopsychrobacter electrodiphilus]|uniref:cytochrome c3 family protein n=1 Tax=Geopsychrobacter electrodiphilus TaxID=225196 RepID=UPI0003A26C68|nr:cytochrome c3 family protein [Geopsychrobacter electrodiphilus]
MNISKLFIVGAILTAIITGCSGSNESNGNGAPAATSNVHSPNNLNPAETAFHGLEAKAQGLDTCKICHGVDLLGSANIPGCNRCHFSLTDFTRKTPVDSNWTHGTIPHNQLISFGETCNACHTALRQYPGQGPNQCHDCHIGATHPLGQAWVDSASQTFHGTAALADVNSCKACHGQDLLGGAAGVSCDKCHFGPTGSRVPVGVTWVHGTSHAPLGSYGATCNQCHTLTRQYRSLPNLCHDCHVHTKDGSYLSPALHGPDAKGSAAFPNGLLDCQSCHGTSGGVGSSPSFTVGIGGQGCEACHNLGTAHPSQALNENIRWYDAVPGDPSVNPDANWGTTHDNYGGSSNAENACFLCHDVEKPLPGQLPSTGMPCKTCHVSDPTGATKGECITCHGNPPDGATVPNRMGRHNRIGHQNQVACNVCHTNNGPDSQDGVIDDPLAYRHFTMPRVQPPVGFSRADLESVPNTAPQSMTITVDPSNVTCTGSCHGQPHSGATWY